MIRTVSAALFLFAIAAPADAGTIAKAYEFKANLPLEVGLDLGDGLVFDRITFEMAPDGPEIATPKARIQISNLGETPRRLGIAIALEDPEGRLVGAGSGGSKLFPLRGGRQMTYTIAFDDVNTEALAASAFRIAFEVR